MMTFTLLAATAALAPSDANFNELREWIVPKQEDLVFQDVPWRPQLWSAVLEARQKEKPILLWAMNGHPMACT